MWPLPFGLIVKQGETRCHTYLSDIATFLSMAYLSIASKMESKTHPEPYVATFACNAANIDMHLICNGQMEAAAHGGSVLELHIQLEEKQPAPPGHTAAGLRDLNTRLVCAMFSLFIDKAGEWVKENYSSDRHQWPQVTNFCRVVRNAIVHGGTININSSTAPSVSWRNLTYGHNDLGKQIINTSENLSTGDLILLMIELELELNELGAPFNLG